MSEDSLPIIDLRLAQGPERNALAKRLVRALEEWGFFYVQGIEGYDESELLEQIKWFFNLPDKVKMSVARAPFNPDTSLRFRGFFPLDDKGVSHMEGYDLGSLEPLEGFHDDEKYANIMYEECPWPVCEEQDRVKKFKEFSQRYYHMMNEAGLVLLELAAEGCGAPSDLLVKLFRPDPLSGLRYLHYPRRDGDNAPKSAYDPQDNSLVLCDAHNDSGFFTLLSTFDFGGLQLRREDGSWMDVPCKKGAVVANIGEMLAAISGGRWRATNHRVVDLGEDRYSVPFFLEPKYSANISLRLPGGGLADEPVWFGPWSIRKQVDSFYEFGALPYPESLTE